jgi:hypothetical protein
MQCDEHSNWLSSLPLILPKSRLHLLEIRISSFAAMGELLRFLLEYPSLRALSILYDSEEDEDCILIDLEPKFAAYPGLVSLSISSTSTGLHYIFLALPVFPFLDSLRCTVLSHPMRSEEDEMLRTGIFCQKFYRRGSRYTKFALLSDLSMRHKGCGDIEGFFFSEHFGWEDLGIQHIYVAVGGHIHITPGALRALSRRFPNLISIHLITLLGERDFTYFDQMRGRLSPLSHSLPQFTYQGLARCTMDRGDLTLHNVLHFISQLPSLRYLSIVFDATIILDDDSLHAEHLRTLHVGTSSIDSNLKHEVAKVMGRCLTQLRRGLCSSEELFPRLAEEHFTSWNWVFSQICKWQDPEDNDFMDPEAEFHEVHPTVLQPTVRSQYLDTEDLSNAKNLRK